MRTTFKTSPFRLVSADTSNTNGTAEKTKAETPGKILAAAVESGELLNENQAAMQPDHDPEIPWTLLASAPSPMKLNK